MGTLGSLGESCPPKLHAQELSATQMVFYMKGKWIHRTLGGGHQLFEEHVIDLNLPRQTSLEFLRSYFKISLGVYTCVSGLTGHAGEGATRSDSREVSRHLGVCKQRQDLK